MLSPSDVNSITQLKIEHWYYLFAQYFIETILVLFSALTCQSTNNFFKAKFQLNL
jgi:hypothetical protein